MLKLSVMMLWNTVPSQGFTITQNMWVFFLSKIPWVHFLLELLKQWTVFCHFEKTTAPDKDWETKIQEMSLVFTLAKPWHLMAYVTRQREY